MFNVGLPLPISSLMDWNGMQWMSGEIAETSFLFTLPKLARVYQCLDQTMPQRWSSPDPSTGWKLTPVAQYPSAHAKFFADWSAKSHWQTGCGPWRIGPLDPPVQTCKVGMQTEGVFRLLFLRRGSVFKISWWLLGQLAVNEATRIIRCNLT